jgi:hypothetical protein
MRSSLKATTWVVLGFALGVLAMERLEARATSALLRALRTTMAVEQEFRASAAARAGDHARAMVYRWQTSELHRTDGQDLLTRKFAELTGAPFSTVAVLVLERALLFGHDPAKQARGAKIVEALKRQELAANLVELGYAAWARDEQSAVERLLGECGCRIPARHATYADLLRDEASESHVAAEHAVLGLSTR